MPPRQLQRPVKNILNDDRYRAFTERYYDRLVDYVVDHWRYRPTWQQVEVLEAMQEPGCRVAMASGHGCFGPGEPMLLHDGSALPVEAIACGDVLKGPDGSPRHVHRLCSGSEELFRFEFTDGTAHVYNSQHVLFLVLNGKSQRVAVQHWLEWSHEAKSRSACLCVQGLEVTQKGIKGVDCLGTGPFFGFELAESPLFLHGDGTVLHNTGKSAIAAWFLDWHLRVFPFSNALITATNIDQARSVIWKYLEEAQADVDRAHPWMAGYFVKETKRYYAKPFKDSWYVIPKTASKSKPENLAGQHNVNYAVFADEASGIEDVIHGVLRGALTHARNRYVMASQPTRPVGHFAEAMTTLAKKDDGTGIYSAFTLNSEESPIVSKTFIREKLEEYGGHHSPEYQIKVLGRLPDNLSGYLIPRQWAEQCQFYVIQHVEAFGYVLTADVAEGVHRDSSVLHVGKVSGHGPDRRVESLECEEYLDLNEKEFARVIATKYHQYPAMTVAVDADGAGRAVILDLEEMGIPVERIHWGLPPHSDADKRRYSNLRAFSHLKLREAIFEERFKGPVNKKWVDQACKLPYKIDERGRYVMTPKEQMKNDGIKSPDISDTACFFFLVDYIPCVEGQSRAEEDAFLAMAKAAMGE